MWFFLFWQKNFHRCQKSKLRVQRKRFREKLLNHNCFFSKFSDFEQRKLGLLAKKNFSLTNIFNGLNSFFCLQAKRLTGVSKQQIICPAEKIDGHSVKHLFFFILFRLWAEKHGILAKKWQGFQNFFYVSRGTVLGRFLEKTNYAFCSSFLVFEKKRGLLAWNLWQVCLNCSFCVHRNVFGVFLEGSLMVRAFSVSERKYPYFRKKIWQVCQNYTIRLQRNNSWTICGRKNICSNFLVF